LKSEFVKSPRVGESPFNLECRLNQILRFESPARVNHFVIGEVVCVHVQDDLWRQGEIDLSGFEAIGRLGGDFYCRTRDRFEMKRPQGPFK
jgi:flavin reductase (DIM6/NTAB) family NADH-FMN oxidoreductase RutF